MSELLQRVADGEFHNLVSRLNSRNARCVDLLHALGDLFTASEKVDGMKTNIRTDISALYGNTTGKIPKPGSMYGYHFGVDSPTAPSVFHSWKVTDVTICKPGDDFAEVIVSLTYTEKPQKAPSTFVARIWASPEKLESFITATVDNWNIDLDHKLYSCKDGNIHPHQETIAKGLMVQVLAMRILQRTLSTFASAITDEIDSINDTSDENFLVASRTLDVCRALNNAGQTDCEAELVQLTSDPNYEPREYTTKHDDVLTLVNSTLDKFLNHEPTSSYAREDPKDTRDATPMDIQSVGVLAEKCRNIWVRAKAGFKFHGFRSAYSQVKEIHFNSEGNKFGAGTYEYDSKPYVYLETKTRTYKIYCLDDGDRQAAFTGPVAIHVWSNKGDMGSYYTQIIIYAAANRYKICSPAGDGMLRSDYSSMLAEPSSNPRIVHIRTRVVAEMNELLDAVSKLSMQK